MLEGKIPAINSKMIRFRIIDTGNPGMILHDYLNGKRMSVRITVNRDVMSLIIKNDKSRKIYKSHKTLKIKKLNKFVIL